MTWRQRIGAWLSLEGSPIGIGEAPSRPAALAAGAVGLTVMALDLASGWIDWLWRWPVHPRVLLAAVAVALLVALGARPRTLGLWGLRPSAGYWVRAIATIALVFGAFLTVVAAMAWFVAPGMVAFPPGYDGRIDRTWLYQGCVLAPLYEETIWRLATVPGLTAAFGRRWAVLLDGAGFAALHFAYGAAGPDNFVGGYIFAWVYLRGGSLWLCMALHGAANLTLDVGRSAVWHMLHG